MKLNDHTQALIAVGASFAANCRPCLQSTMAMARECGVDDQEIAEALEVAKYIRNGAAAKMDLIAMDLIPTAFSGAQAADDGCGCNPPIPQKEGKNE